MTNDSTEAASARQARLAEIAGRVHDAEFGMLDDASKVYYYRYDCRDLLAALKAAEERVRTRPDYDLRCNRCGAPHWFDTVVPSEIWNQFAEPHEILCLLCIDDAMAEKGLRSDYGEFYFVGKALKSRLYHEGERQAEAAAKGDGDGER